MISTEKPGTPAELVHFGVKGMHWGVRKEQETGSRSKSAPKEPFWTPERKDTAKKVAIGAGVLVAVAGTAFVGYKLHQSGKLPISSLKKAASSSVSTGQQAVEKVLQDPTDIIHVSRGKHGGYTFLKKGGTPNYHDIAEKAFGAQSSPGHFEKLANGMIATTIRDPQGRKDFSGRPILHDIVIPRTMTAGINNESDVISKIWPRLKDAYDVLSQEKAHDFIDKSGVSSREAEQAKRYAEQFLKNVKN